jgi:hypothetical protein
MPAAVVPAHALATGTWTGAHRLVLLCLLLPVLTILLLPHAADAQNQQEVFRCITGHNYSSNWNTYRDQVLQRQPPWWYYAYQIDESMPVVEASCGGGFDGCRTEVLIHEREAYNSLDSEYVPFKYAEMILTCTFIDYCYAEDKTYMYNDPNTLVYHTEEFTEYTHKVQRIVTCCNDDINCNIDTTGQYANQYVSGERAGVSACLVATAALGMLQGLAREGAE